MHRLTEISRNDIIPWSADYNNYKHRYISEVINNQEFLNLFVCNSQLPECYGARLDERIIEYPWVMSRIRNSGLILDAGSTFNNELILKHKIISSRKILIYTLEADWITLNPNVSYIFSDFRYSLLKDKLFDIIVCISTLEHVGFGGDFRKWSKYNLYPNEDVNAYKEVLMEFSRMLTREGQFLLTVPFGRYENHGWLRQFDKKLISTIHSAFEGQLKDECYYRYNGECWELSDSEACCNEKYFNFHAEENFDDDYAAAARAVACLEYIKSE